LRETQEGVEAIADKERLAEVRRSGRTALTISVIMAVVTTTLMAFAGSI
jgi:hypothetical protein